ncbi:DUF4136 domain-containing protein [Chitinophaga lutea]
MKRNTTLLLALLIYLSACRKEPDLSELSGNFVVQTDAASGTNFSAYKTYYISDTIALVSDNKKDSILIGAGAQQVIAAIKQNMSARGYTFVPKIAKPDLGINTVAFKNVTVGVVYPGWWWGYPGYWDPWYWGWYYPYYYPWSVAYAVTTGSLIGELIDLKNVDASQKLQVIWTFSLNGALGSDQTNTTRAVDGVNQAFTQSEYLKAN